MPEINKNIVRFRGREFEVISQGHSSEQLADFVHELINENKVLSEKVKSLVYLEKLAHQKLIEADKIAASIESEAKTEAAAIKQEAQEQAAKLIEQVEGKIKKATELAEGKKQKAQSKADELTQQTEVDSDSESLAPVTNASRDNNKLTEATAEISMSVLENAVELVEHAQNKIQEARVLAQKVKREPQSSVGESIGEAKAEYEPTAIVTYTSQQNDDPAIPSGEISLHSSENATIHQGEIDILVTPPVSMIQLIRIRRSLLEIPNLRIIRTSGSLDEGSVITTLADKSSIINIFNRMTDVEKIEIGKGDERDNYNLSVLRELRQESEPKSRETIVITLRKSL